METELTGVKRERAKIKNKLIEEVIDMIAFDPYNYEELTHNLCRQALWKWTDKQLKEIL